MIGSDFFSALEPNTFDRPLLQNQFGDLALKTIFPAQTFDGGAERFHHGHQPEGADMGMGLGENFFRRAGVNELFQHLAP